VHPFSLGYPARSFRANAYEKKRRKNHMTKFIIRAALVLTFLLTLGVIFGGITSAPAYAATTSAHLISKGAIASDLTPTACSHPDLAIVADNNTHNDCFSGLGPLSVTIYNVTIICSYNHYAAIVAHYDNQPGTNRYMTPHQCLTFDRPLNVVTGIVLYDGR
jgi:hypothetical protein